MLPQMRMKQVKPISTKRGVGMEKLNKKQPFKVLNLQLNPNVK